MHRNATRQDIVSFALTIALSACAGAKAMPTEERTFRDRVDTEVRRVLEQTKAPSASVAVVRDGVLVYAHAFGQARLDPAVPAAPTMRYCIGSISKQFTAAAILLLQEDHALSLDDTVARYFPEVPGAGAITLRALLSHTAGIRDYWPQDYVFPAMKRPISRDDFLRDWVMKPLDFEPGSDWQYSNTGYVLAGLIAEKAAKRPLFELLRDRIFEPLRMASVRNVDDEGRDPSDAVGYARFGLGPFRPAPTEARGWLYAAGELAMTAEDLARWDLAMIEGRILSAESWKELRSEVRLADGVGTQYGLGVVVTRVSRRRQISHIGGVSGFASYNRVLPDQRAAIVVLVNTDGNEPVEIADRVTEVMFVDDSPESAVRLARARDILLGLQRGVLDRSLFSANANEYFTSEAISDLQHGLAPLGSLKELTQVDKGQRGGMETRVYKARLANGSLEIVQRELPNGMLEQFIVGLP